jgi:hypothetical protein
MDSGFACYLLRSDFLLDFFFDPEDGGDIFLSTLRGVISLKIVRCAGNVKR